MERLVHNKEKNAIISLHLQTREFFAQDQKASAEEIEESRCKQKDFFKRMEQDYRKYGIVFTYEFSNNLKIHDRKIIANNGWIIKPGKGLDMWMRCPRDPYENNIDDAQRRRPCYGGMDISYIRKENYQDLSENGGKENSLA